MPDPLRLAEIHLNLLYVTDIAGRMVGSRDPDVPTPLIHLVRTPAGNRWYVAAFLPAQLRAMADYILANEPVIPDLDALESTPPILQGLEEMLTRPDATPQLYRGPVFAFDTPLPTTTAPPSSWKTPQPRRPSPSSRGSETHRLTLNQ